MEGWKPDIPTTSLGWKLQTSEEGGHPAIPDSIVRLLTSFGSYFKEEDIAQFLLFIHEIKFLPSRRQTKYIES